MAHTLLNAPFEPPVWDGDLRRRIRTGPGRASVPCAGCGTAVAVAAKGPIPKWCGQTCRQRCRAAAEVTAGCFHPVYEALTVAINQLTHTGRSYIGERQFGFMAHPALAGRERIIADQLDTTSLSVTGRDPAVARRLQIAYERPDRRRKTRMQRRFPNGL